MQCHIVVVMQISQQASCNYTESQAAEAKRLLARERKALQEAKHALSNNEASPPDHAEYSSKQPVGPSQVRRPSGTQSL